MAAALAVFVIVIFALEAYRAKKEEKRFVESLYGDYFKIADKKY